LERADEIIIIGYSFPEADIQFRLMFQDALTNNYRNVRKEHIKVVVVNDKRYLEDKIAFERHYKGVLEIPGIDIRPEFKWAKFGMYVRGDTY